MSERQWVRAADGLYELREYRVVGTVRRCDEHATNSHVSVWEARLPGDAIGSGCATMADAKWVVERRLEKAAARRNQEEERP